MMLMSACVCGLCYRALQEAQEIFGVDFDFEEFEQYEDEEEEDDVEDEVSQPIEFILSACVYMYQACPKKVSP